MLWLLMHFLRHCEKACLKLTTWAIKMHKKTPETKHTQAYPVKLFNVPRLTTTTFHSFCIQKQVLKYILDDLFVDGNGWEEIKL